MLFGDDSGSVEFDANSEFARSWAKAKNRLKQRELENFIQKMDNESVDIMDSLYPEVKLEDENDTDSSFMERYRYCYEAINDIYEKNNPYPWFGFDEQFNDSIEDIDDFELIERTKRRLCNLVIHCSSVTSRNKPYLGNILHIVPTDSLQSEMDKVLDKNGSILLYNVPYTGKSTFCKQYVIEHQNSYYYQTPPASFSLDEDAEEHFPDMKIWNRISTMAHSSIFDECNPYRTLDCYKDFTIFIDGIKKLDICSLLSIPDGCRTVFIWDDSICPPVISRIYPYLFSNSSYRDCIIRSSCYDASTNEKNLTDIDEEAAEVISTIQEQFGDLLEIYKLYAALYRSEKKQNLCQKCSPIQARVKALETLTKIIRLDDDRDNPKISYDLDGAKTSSGLPFQTHIRNLFSFLGSQEQDLLRILYRLSQTTGISPYEFSQYLSLYDPELNSFNLADYFDRLSELGWIEGSYFSIPKQVVAAVSVPSHTIKNDELEYYLCFAVSLTYTMRGLSSTYINKNIIFSLIRCMHEEFKVRVHNKRRSKSKGRTEEYPLTSRSNAIIQYFYQEAVQFCNFYSETSYENGGHDQHFEPLVYQLLSFIQGNPEFFIIDKRNRPEKEAMIEHHVQMMIFNMNGRDRAIFPSLVKAIPFVLENYTRFCNYHFGETDSQRVLEKRYIDDRYLTFVLLLNYYIMECNYMFCQIICKNESGMVEDVTRDLHKIDSILIVLYPIIVHVRHNSSDPEMTCDTYKEVANYLLHSYKLMRNHIPHNQYSSSINEMQYFKKEDEIHYCSGSDSLVTAQQLLVDYKIEEYCTAKGRSPVFEEVASDSPVFKEASCDINSLYERCGDLPDVIGELIKVVDDVMERTR